jgi:hypothetical protein
MTFDQTLAALPLRRTYPRGKLRPIKQAESDAFNAAVMAYMEGYPLAPIRVPTDDWTAEGRRLCCMARDEDEQAWLVDTEFGPLRVAVPRLDHEVLFTVWTCFMGTPDQCCAAAKAFDSNPFSGKWNVHQYEAADALRQLDHQLMMANAASKPTPVLGVSPH